MIPQFSLMAYVNVIEGLKYDCHGFQEYNVIQITWVHFNNLPAGFHKGSILDDTQGCCYFCYW